MTSTAVESSTVEKEPQAMPVVDWIPAMISYMGTQPGLPGHQSSLSGVVWHTRSQDCRQEISGSGQPGPVPTYQKDMYSRF